MRVNEGSLGRASRGRRLQSQGASNRLLSDALSVAVLTACAYLLAMLYEVGYFRYFAIPELFMIPTPYVLLGGLLGVIWVLALFVPIMSVLMVVLRLVPGEELRFRLVVGVVGCSGVALVFGGGLITACAAISLGVWLVYFLVERALRSTEKGWRRVVAGFTAPITKEASPALDAIEARFGVAPIAAFFLMYLAGLIAFVSGSAVARLQTTFHVSIDRENLAIVRSYGDYVVGFEVDPAQRRATGRYVVQKLSDGQTVNTERRKIGPLSGPR